MHAQPQIDHLGKARKIALGGERGRDFPLDADHRRPDISRATRAAVMDPGGREFAGGFAEARSADSVLPVAGAEG